MIYFTAPKFIIGQSEAVFCADILRYQAPDQMKLDLWPNLGMVNTLLHPFGRLWRLTIPKFAINQSEALSCPDILRYQVTDLL